MASKRRIQLLHLCTPLILTLLAGGVTRAQSVDPSTSGACAGTSNPCVWTYHNDNARDGVNPNEATLIPALFPVSGSANFGLLVPTPGGPTGAVDGLVYAQPLYLSGVSMASTSGCPGTQNIVLVATENNSVYAFTWTYTLSASGYTFSLTQCWMLNFNQSGEYAIPFTALPPVGGATCSNIVPQSGITSTPVIDTTVTPPVMYAVSAHQLANGAGYTYRLHAVLINKGIEAPNGNSPYDLSSVFTSPVTAAKENQRPGLAMFKPSSGKAYIYVGFGVPAPLVKAW